MSENHLDKWMTRATNFMEDLERKIAALISRVEALEKTSLEPEDIPMLQRVQGDVAELQAAVEALENWRGFCEDPGSGGMPLMPEGYTKDGQKCPPEAATTRERARKVLDESVWVRADAINGILDALEEAGCLGDCKAQDSDDLTAAYMAGYEKGKDERKKHPAPQADKVAEATREEFVAEFMDQSSRHQGLFGSRLEMAHWAYDRLFTGDRPGWPTEDGYWSYIDSMVKKGSLHGGTITALQKIYDHLSKCAAPAPDDKPLFPVSEGQNHDLRVEAHRLEAENAALRGKDREE